jgi:hypothetical protein
VAPSVAASLPRHGLQQGLRPIGHASRVMVRGKFSTVSRIYPDLSPGENIVIVMISPP